MSQPQRYTHLYTDPRGVTTLTLNRPEVNNALNAQFIDELSQVFDTLARLEELTCLIIKGQGKHFCAGADLKWMKDSAQFSFEENKTDAKALSDLLLKIHHFSKPIIGCVHGAIYGGAIGLVACCDWVLACSSSQFCFSEVKLGLIPAIISPFILQKIGYSNTKAYFLSAAKMDASKALALGLCHQISSPETLATDLDTLVRSWCQNGPKALALAKQLVNDLNPMPMTASMVSSTIEAIATVRTSEEGQEGLAAFFEKRPPKWCQGSAL